MVINMDVSLIIPVYNESKIILNTIRTASKKLAELTSSYEILIVDDGSTDGTAALVENCRDSHVYLIHYAPNHGKGMAVRTGMLTAKGNIIICTDADLAYGVDVFGRILGRFATTDTDIVAGTRSDRADAYQNYPPLRRFISKGFRLVVQLFSRLNYDTQCGIKGFRKQAAQVVYRRCTINGFSFDIEVLMWADRLGLKVNCLPVSVVNFRESKIHVIRDSCRMLFDLFRIRWRVRKKPNAEDRLERSMP